MGFAVSPSSSCHDCMYLILGADICSMTEWYEGACAQSGLQLVTIEHPVLSVLSVDPPDESQRH